jgi:L-ascorbate metabolism protein UlaG (beta-lactamase superfamily)
MTKEKNHMKRRQLIRYANAGLLTALAATLTSGFQPYRAAPKTSNSVLVQWLGQTCFLFTGSGLRILVNPFRAIGCTAGYRLPKVEADLVLVSSQLWDEGAAEGLPGNPRVLYEPGVYEINGIKFQGISIAHDREGGRRFGNNVAWRWNQGGIKILHLGGAAAPIALEQKILMGTPDLALIPVGGGPKAYNPEEAKQAMQILNPKVLIPTQYLTQGADKNACDLVGIDEFLKLIKGMNIRRIDSDKIRLQPKDLPKEGTIVRILSYQAALKPPNDSKKPQSNPTAK